MSKITSTSFALLLLLFLSNGPGTYAAQSIQNSSDRPSGTLQKMIVENGSVSMSLDLNRLNGISCASQDLQQARFAVGANSFFPVLVFNDLLRGPAPGTMALVPRTIPTLHGALNASFNRLVIEKLPSGQGFDLAVRDANTGFTFFNIEGHQYDYEPAAKSIAITVGRLFISKEFANALGRPSDAAAVAGTISIAAAMQPIQIEQLVTGETKSMVMPHVQHEADPAVPTLVPGPDVIVGNIEDVDQQGRAGSQGGLA